MKVFDANGYNNTTIADICSASNISRSTFFTHFASKSDLLVDMGAQIANSWHEKKTTLTPKTSLDLLKSLALFLFENSENTPLARSIAADFIVTHGNDYSAGEGSGTIFAAAYEIIAAAQKEKLITKKLSATTLGHFFLSGCFPFMEMLEVEPPEKVAELYFECFLKGAAH